MSTIDAEVFERYASEAAFLWGHREAAVRSPLHDLESLCELDERLEAHLDGLRLAGDEGCALCKDALDDDDAGAVFAGMVLAVERQDLQGIAHVLDAAGGDPERARAVVSALGWTDVDRVKRILSALLYPRVSPALHYLGIAAGAAHRLDLGAALGDAVYASDLRLRARALRAVGQLGRADLLRTLRLELSAEDERCRLAAAWSATILGEMAAIPVLLDLAGRSGPHTARAVDMALRRMESAAAATWLLARSPEHVRTALAGAAALGDPALVPWLLDRMASPGTARAAGAVLTMITGVDLAAEKLETSAPEGFRAGPSDDPGDDDIAMDPDGNLPWPDVEKVHTWWSRRGADFPPGTRLLLGRPMTDDWLARVLRVGSQPARAAAATEICLGRGRALFEVRAPGKRQRRALGGE